MDASYLNRNLINALSIVGFVSVADDAIQARWRAVLDQLIEKFGNQRALAPKLELSQARISQVKNGERVNGDMKLAIVRLLGHVPLDLLEDPDIAAFRKALSRTSDDPAPTEATSRYGDHPDWPAIWTAALAELPNPDDPGWRAICEWMATKEYQLPTPLTPGIVAGFARWARQNQWILPRKTTQTGPHKAGGVKKTGNS